MSTNKILAVYKNAEDKTGEAHFFDSLSDLKTHIQNETCEFLGEEGKEPKDMVILNKDNVYYEEGFQMHHSWTVFEAVITSVQEEDKNLIPEYDIEEYIYDYNEKHEIKISKSNFHFVCEDNEMISYYKLKKGTGMPKCDVCGGVPYEEYADNSLCERCYRLEVISWLNSHVKINNLSELPTWKLEEKHKKYSILDAEGKL